MNYGTNMRVRSMALPATPLCTRRSGRVIAIAALVLLPEVAMASIFGSLFAGSRPAEVGTGVLATCPDKPNCVRSGAADPRHAIAPIAATAPLPDALAALVGIAAAMPGARVVTARADYAHLEFATPLMGFVDDVELAVDPAGGVIHVRSASRVGTSDFGVNRKRIDDLRRAFAAAGKAGAPAR
jgi:uncharacterized protein (DUF1499 family)